MSSGNDIQDILINRRNFFEIINEELPLVSHDFYLLIIDEENNIIKANRKFINDFKVEDKPGKTWSSNITRKSYAPTYYFTENTSTNKQNLRKNDDRYVWVQWHNYPSEVNGKKCTFKFGFDITEAEKAAHSFLQINDHAKIGFWRVDLIDQSLFWSDEIYNIHGLSKNKYTPTLETAINHYHEDDVPVITQSVEKCIATGQPFNVRLRVNLPQGQVAYVESIGTPEYDDDNKIIAISGTIKDRTQSTLFEENHEKTRENLANLKSISSHLRRTLDEHAIISATDASGKIQYANTKFCDISGYSTDELIGKTHSIVKSDIHPPEFYQELWDTIRSGRTWQGEICNTKKNGDYYWVYSTIVPFISQKTGKPEQYISVRTDITRQKETQKKLDQLYFEALAASDAKTKFIANMSHELRTPLNHIIGFTEIVQGMNKNPDLEESLAIIRSAGDELLSKVENVLNLVESKSTEQDHNHQTDVIDLLSHDILPYMETLAKTKDQNTTNHIPASVKRIYCDTIDLQNSLRQLVKNACQFSQNKDTVGIEVTETDAKVHITVFDTGPGLPDEITSSKLDPFNIGETVLTKSSSGMGLGLPLAKSLCQKNGGFFNIETENGNGTRVKLSFFKVDE